MAYFSKIKKSYCGRNMMKTYNKNGCIFIIIHQFALIAANLYNYANQWLTFVQKLGIYCAFRKLKIVFTTFKLDLIRKAKKKLIIFQIGILFTFALKANMRDRTPKNVYFVLRFENRTMITAIKWWSEQQRKIKKFEKRQNPRKKTKNISIKTRTERSTNVQSIVHIYM